MTTIDTKSNVSGTSISLLPGMQVTLKVEQEFAKTGLVTINKVKRTPLRGFIVEDESVGTIEEVSTKDTIVLYKHNKPASNRIYFINSFGGTGLINIIYTPIHDHSTIITGGPANGTYSSAYVKEE